MSDTRVVARTGYADRLCALVGTGALATLLAVVAVTLAAGLLRALGVDFEADGGETIPVSGIAVVTAFFSGVGTVIAAVLLRWSTHPAEWFVATAATLTAVSFVPPALWAVDVTTSFALVALHVVVAAVMVPALARALRSPLSPR